LRRSGPPVMRQNWRAPHCLPRRSPAKPGRRRMRKRRRGPAALQAGERGGWASAEANRGISNIEYQVSSIQFRIPKCRTPHPFSHFSLLRFGVRYSIFSAAPGRSAWHLVPPPPTSAFCGSVFDIRYSPPVPAVEADRPPERALTWRADGCGGARARRVGGEGKSQSQVSSVQRQAVQRQASPISTFKCPISPLADAPEKSPGKLKPGIRRKQRLPCAR